MRVLKTILIIVLALLAVMCLLGFIGQDNFRYARSTTIAAPAEVVYGHIRKLSGMQEWGPWQAMDRDQVQSLEGTDGSIGSVWKWEGDTVGKGMQELTSLEPNTSVRTKLTFIVPVIGEMVSTGTYDLESMGDSTKITWGMEGENGFWGKLMSKFGDNDAMMGPMFETGLANLKTMAEAEAAALKADLAAKTSGGYVIEMIDRPETVYVGKRNKKVKWNDMGAFYGSTFGAAGKALGAAKIELAGPPSGVLWEWNETTRTADVMAGMPVKASADVKVEGMETYVIPASKMLMTPYYGDYAKNMSAHVALDEYIKAKGLTHYGNVIEEYVTDPMAEPDTAKWLTNVYYMVK